MAWKNVYVSHTIKEEINTLHKIRKRKGKWICHVLRRNCILKYIIEETLEGVTEGRGWKCKQLLNDIMETTGYWKSKEEALDRTLWRTLSGRGYGLLVRQTAEWMNEWMNEWAATCLPSTPLVCPNNLSVSVDTLYTYIVLMSITWQCKQLRQLHYLRHRGSMNGIHFITLSLTAISAFEQDIQQPHGMVCQLRINLWLKWEEKKRNKDKK